jgi:hypothetical protein
MFSGLLLMPFYRAKLRENRLARMIVNFGQAERSEREASVGLGLTARG